MLTQAITVEELCKRLAVRLSWVYQRTARKEIPHYKIGRHVRFDTSEIETWLATKKMSMAPERELPEEELHRQAFAFLDYRNRGGADFEVWADSKDFSPQDRRRIKELLAEMGNAVDFR